eukprot:3016711-Rhodomonas_salina.1
MPRPNSYPRYFCSTSHYPEDAEAGPSQRCKQFPSSWEDCGSGSSGSREGLLCACLQALREAGR